jgi:4-hydroxy-3-methylbut-2-enyl diphosphate reductase
MSENEVFMSQQESDVSFSDMIDSIPQLHRGATVKGTIVRYDADNVYVDVHDKSEGRIPRHEFESDPDFDLDQAIADHTDIDVYVRSIRNTELGKEILLSKARVDFGKYKALIEDAFANKTPISVKVVNVVKDGVIASYGGVDIYIHRTQLEMFPVEDLESYRGQTLDIVVTQYDPDKRRLRVSGSRRVLLNAERRTRAEGVWTTIAVGNTYEGVVRSLTDFGAFVDIGGVDGLVHVSELSWNRIRHPSQVVTVGDRIEVYVKDFDPEKKRISLGYKKADQDPYHDIEERFPVGSTVHGTVVRMFPFGAFIEIAEGVDALCHISQISNVRLVKPNDVLSEGMEVDARVLEVSNADRRISISIKAVEPIDPVYAEPAVEAPHEEMTEYIDGVTVIEKQEEAAPTSEE